MTMVLLTLWLAAQTPAADLHARANAVVDALVAGDYAKISADYTDAMKTAMPDARLAATWSALTAQFGPLKQRGTPRTTARAELQVVALPLEFERGILEMTLTFNPAGKIGGMGFRPPTPATVPYAPPAYVDAARFTERDVIIGTAPWQLPGTLAMPVGPGPFPAVVLVHGSGPHDRDETIGPNRVFKDLALGLASRGIAVLRYEKRSKEHAGRMSAASNFTVKDEAIDDAVAAVAVLKTTAGVDPRRIVVAGHSLGGMLIPRIAEADPQIGGLVVLAGPAESLEQAILRQTKYLTEADGSVSPEEQKQIAGAEAIVASVAQLTPETRATAAPIAGVPASYWLDLRGYDPPRQSVPLRQPMFVLQGERDYQVTMVDFGRWKAALGTRPNVTFRSYPALNHLFIAGEGKSLPTEYARPGHVAEEVVRDLAAWILASVK